MVHPESDELREEEAKKKGGSVYDITNEWVASIEPQDNSEIARPFLNGSNEDPLAKGTFVGLTAYHNKKHMLRAVYEGIVFSHVTHVKKLLRNREVPRSIRLSEARQTQTYGYRSLRTLFRSLWMW